METRIKLVFLLIAFFLIPPSYCAVPARPGYFNVTQPDGAVFTARLRGDEFGYWTEREDGRSVVKGAGGWWFLAREKNGILVETTVRADTNPALLSAVPLHQKPARWEPVEGLPVKGGFGGVKSRVNGSAKVLVLLINFTDNPRVNAGKYTGPYYSNLLFNESNNLSMNSFYIENSYGAFNISGEVGGPDKWYTSSHPMSYYGRDGGGVDDYYTQTYTLVCEAASLANADVDFSQYDADSNGYLDYVIVVHAGCGQEDSIGCDMPNPIWSVRWSGGNLCPGQTFDGKTIISGTILAEDSPMGTFAHEMGHDFGNLPDLYDTDYSSEGIGDWGVMGSGSWNGPMGYDGQYPSHFCAWSKYFMGWVSPTVVSSELLGEQVDAVESSPDVYQIMIPLGDTPVNPSDGGEKEYFLVENRQGVGFDSYIPGSGILIWHVDDNQARISANSFNSYDSDRGVDLEESDEDTQPNSGLDGQYPWTGDRGVSADAWKSDSGGFTDSGTPNSKSKAAASTYINVTDISASGSSMTVDFLGSGSASVGSLILLDGAVVPSAGYSDEVFNYSVTYVSGNGSAPTEVNVSVDGVFYAMGESNGSDANYSDGKDFYFNSSLEAGLHNFSFSAWDGVYLNSTPVYVGPNVTDRPGYLTAELVSPNASVNVTRDVFFNLTARVSCVQGPCGDVMAVMNWSEGLVLEDNGTPFYTTDPNPRFTANLSCLVNLSANESCNVTWAVNATGEDNITYGLMAYFVSQDSTNDTGFVYATILSLTPRITNPSPQNNTIFEPYTDYLTLSLQTNRNAFCRHANATGQDFGSMQEFAQTNSTNHSTNITGLVNGQTMNVYVKCNSTDGFLTDEEYRLSYRVASPNVALNELSPSGDWLELFNLGETAINLSGWVLEHDFWVGYKLNTTSVNYTLDSVISGFLLLEYNQTNISLKYDMGDVLLWDVDGVLVDNVSYLVFNGNHSFGRRVDGTGAWEELANPTPGEPNTRYYSTEWPMFRQNPARNGTTPASIPSNMTLNWNETIGSRVRSSPALSGGLLYAGSWEGVVYGLNALNGTQVWNQSTGDSISSSPAVSSGSVFIATSSGAVYCLNASSGNEVWVVSLGSAIESSPLEYYDIAYVGANDGRMYALNASTGAQLWNYSTGSSVRSSAAADAGLVYFGSNDNRVYALNASTGAHVWNYSTTGIVYSTPAVSEGVIVFGSYDNRVYALNASTGASEWSYLSSGAVWSSPAVDGGVVYAGSRDKRVYALNLSSGALLWNYTTGDEVVSSPSVSGDRVFVGSKDGRIYGLNKVNGSVEWSNLLGGAVWTQPSISYNRLFVGADDGRVYAFGVFNDTTGPTVELLSPPNGSMEYNGNLTLEYNVSDQHSGITGCTLVFNGQANESSTNVSETVIQSFDVLNLVNGSYNWSVTCVDDSENLNAGSSQTGYFNVSIRGYEVLANTIKTGWNLISLTLEP